MSYCESCTGGCFVECILNILQNVFDSVLIVLEHLYCHLWFPWVFIHLLGAIHNWGRIRFVSVVERAERNAPNCELTSESAAPLAAPILPNVAGVQAATP